MGHILTKIIHHLGKTLINNKGNRDGTGVRCTSNAAKNKQHVQVLSPYTASTARARTACTRGCQRSRSRLNYCSRVFRPTGTSIHFRFQL